MKYLGAITDNYDIANKKYVDDAVSAATQVSYATTTLTGHTNKINFVKQGHVINAYMNGDWTSLAHGEYAVVGTIPEGYAPTLTGLLIPEQTSTGHNIILYLNTNGTIGAYNYYTFDITKNTNGRYNVTYII